MDQTNNLITRIQKSIASLNDEESFKLFLDLIVNEKQWVFYSSVIVDYDKVFAIGENFISYHASIESSLGSMYSPQPLHVFKFKNIKGFSSEGILYSNGAIAICDDANEPEKNEQLLFVWIDQKVVDTFDYPI